jgi:hypothetical protein
VRKNKRLAARDRRAPTNWKLQISGGRVCGVNVEAINCYELQPIRYSGWAGCDRRPALPGAVRPNRRSERRLANRSPVVRDHSAPAFSRAFRNHPRGHSESVALVERTGPIELRQLLGLLSRLASRTPEPPPFSGINTMPASKNARSIAASVTGLARIGPGCPSNRLIVGRDTFDAAVKSFCSHRSSMRAALTCSLVSAAGFAAFRIF